MERLSDTKCDKREGRGKEIGGVRQNGCSYGEGRKRNGGARARLKEEE